MTNVLELDERLETALEAYRKDHEASANTELREVLEAFLSERGYLERKRRLPRSVGIVKNGIPDLAERTEELLWSER
jgi:hypothetical protein